MREILFRGKNAKGEWEYGVPLITGLHSEIVYITQANSYTYRVEIDTVGQYTGLTDKNGKKIFEGDIGRYKQTDGVKSNGKLIICTGAVVYNEKTASFAVDGKYFDYFPIKDFEVIGNIHDNPELLKGE